MKYRVKGADRETGQEVEATVEAQDASAASAKANGLGILVAECSVEADDGIETKSCPFCAETIKAKAIKCRFCGASLLERAEISPKRGNGKPQANANTRVASKRSLIIAAVAIAVAFFGTFTVYYFVYIAPIHNSVVDQNQQINSRADAEVERLQRQLDGLPSSSVANAPTASADTPARPSEASSVEQWREAMAQEIGGDLVLSAVFDQFPEVKDDFEKARWDLLESKLRLLFMTGKLSLEGKQHVDAFLREARRKHP